MPTGTTPSASGTSWLAHATVATRSGWASIVVSPNACLMVTGNCAVGADEDSVVAVGSASAPQPARLASGERRDERGGKSGRSHETLRS